MPGQTYSIPELREKLAKTIKNRVGVYEADLLELRKRELAKSQSGTCLLCGNADTPGLCTCLLTKAAIEKCGEKMSTVSPVKVKKGELCADCGCKDCKCPGVVPGDKPSKDVTPKKSGAGSTIPRRFKKADVPMSAPPTKAGTAAAPKSTGGSPKVTAAPKPPASPMGKSQSRIPGYAPLAKAGPRIGGKDPLSQGMTSDAARAAAPAPMAAAAPAPKLAPDAQAARAQQYTDFTPAGAFHAPGKGAVAGEMKAPPAGVNHLAIPSVGAKPVGGGVLQRFTDALQGKKKDTAPAFKSEFAKSLGGCLLCSGHEHDGACPKT